MAMPFHDRYRALVRDIEQDHPVMDWRWGDVDLWPQARMGLYMDFYGRHAGAWQHPLPRSRLRGIAADALRPLLNVWRSRHDLAGLRYFLPRADAVLLGDGTSLDFVDGAWRDRFGEPLLAALEEQGSSTLLMQQGDFRRVPRLRASYMANVIQSRGRLRAPFLMGEMHLPDHAAVMTRLARENVDAPSLSLQTLDRLGRGTAAAATSFEHLLQQARPRRAFVVGYYAGSGPAFVLACHRRGVPIIDIQRAPLVTAPMAYDWVVAPGKRSTLPTLFWTWTEEEAFVLAKAGLQAMAGGHAQLADAASDCAWQGDFQREILVALQPIAGHREDWAALALAIEAAPASWRWWIRRHPASDPAQDEIFGKLLSARPNVEIAEASRPLIELLLHMSVVVSLGSGVAVEAALHGVPALFLSPAAAMPFADLIAQGMAHVVPTSNLCEAIAALPAPRRRIPSRPDLAASLGRLRAMV